MTSAEIREAFLRYFESQGHTRVASSSLVPANDPTLLFTNAGMNQFKDCFLGAEKRDYVRAVSSQKCVRAGGKHNDLDNVGYTARHHTFFEMLGNFSFGDYFKRDAIKFAWEFLTSEQWLALPKDRLYATVYHTDDEAFDIWNKEIGLDAERIIRIGDNKGEKYASDNFWAMGDTGPCGPCSEIFYDHGDHIWGGLPGTPEEDGDRFIEIWNNVFMQFNRTADGVLHALPAPSVDTGMGLERISAVLQHVNSNYEIDLFQHLLKAAAEIIGVDTASLEAEAKEKNTPVQYPASLKVVADHARSCCFLIADGVNPSNEGRGYVLRRIIRRAVRHGNKLGATGTFFYKMLQPLIEVMGTAYPELEANKARIEAALIKEEEQFAKTLEQGLKLLEGELTQLKGSIIPGEIVFKLYDTYGFPVDLTADIARERDLSIDEAGFEKEMAAQRQRAREAGKFAVDYNSIVKVEDETEFSGYDATEGQGQIIAIYKDGTLVDEVTEGDEALIVLNQTPFYAESGGQIGDTGIFKNETGIFEVQDTKKSGNAFVHQGIVTMGNLKVTQNVEATVKAELRAATARNHSATHLLHAALRQILGSHVQQKGSLVASDILRFDFANDQPVTFEQLQQIERLVNAEVIANTAVTTELLDIETAKTKGAMMLFGEKYGSEVRVLSMGSVIEEKNFSVELCGGIHVKRTGDIGLFKITSESGVAAGIRRIEAVTGTKALELVQKADSDIHQINSLLKAQKDQTVERVQTAVENVSALQKQIEQLNQKLANFQAAELLSQVQTVAGRSTLITTVQGMDAKSLRNLHDSTKSKLDHAVIVLAGVDGDKVSLIASVAKDFTSSIKAGDIIKHLATELGGKGGGKPDLAQGGAPLNEKFEQVMADLTAWLEAK
ncbi:alanyl-tRNA synthetase [Acinetobacter radioresistens DSM 6976 = NBRC 102413 = CIP 103788]|uniref:alanine--tRNA ligase n=2 Tax=Moraxellaceae TaxID=468 RepID=UPI0002CF3A9F|nr:alanine--tRNA ligase [Acinetobacter radioresistens]ENV88065.1 alanyl-tRNA synthetase [Acinetobacter radioresistens NIPH 2130]EXB86547.1 alanine--tRNA ligase [Acinetobacter sp. 272263]EXC33415.1 alanine--tRNA ligase [Acinetobacter sp. 869535]EXE13932.1 alanine--tRNA ligase [Acinetobacter sp. 983759]KCX39125.1 alanine--tRNA ligase [Acinetobacter sp. 263903-1]